MASTDTGVSIGSLVVVEPSATVGGATGCGTPMTSLARPTVFGPSDRDRATGLTR